MHVMGIEAASLYALCYNSVESEPIKNITERIFSMNKLPLLLGGFGGRGRVFRRRLRRLLFFLGLKQISLETSNVVVDVEERRVGLGPATDVGHEGGRKKEG